MSGDGSVSHHYSADDYGFNRDETMPPAKWTEVGNTMSQIATRTSFKKTETILSKKGVTDDKIIDENN